MSCRVGAARPLAERLSSAVFKQLMTTVRDSELLRDALGDAIRPEPVWWANGDPVVNGAVCLSVNLSGRDNIN